MIDVGENDLNLKTKLDLLGNNLEISVNINQAIALKEDRSKSLFLEKSGDNYKKVLDGRNINRYSTTWSGSYLAYDVNKIHSCKRIDIFEAKEKIFFRRVGVGLISSYDTEQYYGLHPKKWTGS